MSDMLSFRAGKEGFSLFTGKANSTELVPFYYLGDDVDIYISINDPLSAIKAVIAQKMSLEASGVTIEFKRGKVHEIHHKKPSSADAVVSNKRHPITSTTTYGSIKALLDLTSI
eukprot:TRINITY_DN23069_c0_g1_i1.p1 TRINITY_DN23069_c0_g1~~TRINITY_DN23069_c0_g1_i1.p1  ORF type:complete len:114 (-),score=19.09 TRINITY_DN23069_c0_g1_i1:51-392(-)